uniref:RILP-like protein 1 n=1 Tax=Myxine glutinosa TaxID=7769 RepID=UPI00358E0D42
MSTRSPYAAFEALTRKHGVVCVPPDEVSVEHIVIAIGNIIGMEKIRAASRMNKRIVFLAEESLVHEVVAAEQRQSLEKPLTLEELSIALKSLGKGKSPASTLQLQVTRLIRLNAELRASLSRYKKERERADSQTRNDKRKTLKEPERKIPGQNDDENDGKRGTREQSLGLRATTKDREQWDKWSQSNVKARCTHGCKCKECVQQDKERPRFTLSELNSVLHDRNELKAELLSLKEKANDIRTDFHQEMPSPSALPMSPTESNVKRLINLLLKSSDDDEGQNGREMVPTCDIIGNYHSL